MIFNNGDPINDFGKQAECALAMQLEAALALYGLPATIYKAAVYDNPYEPQQPEFVQEKAPAGNCRVLLGQPFEGINLTNFISLADKVEKQIHLTTNVQLNTEDELHVMFPDEKSINLRILEPWAFHASSTVAFRYVAIVN